MQDAASRGIVQVVAMSLVCKAEMLRNANVTGKLTSGYIELKILYCEKNNQIDCCRAYLIIISSKH